MNNQCDINQLFGEISWQGFIEQYWQKKSYYVQGQNTEYFASLISRQEIDTLIKTNGGKTDFVISLIGGKIVNPEKGVGHKAPSYWTAGNVFESFEKGSTIRLGNIASHCLSIRKLQQHFEANLQTDININLYLTPPGSRAFGAHYDDHDVFIVQISGSKIWKLFSPAEESPVEVLHRGRAGWLKKEMPGSKKVRPLPIPDQDWSIKMQAGDLLYVPRGHVHQVYSEDEESLHLTVAVTVVTWYEVVVQALLETLKESDALREALPPDISNRNFNTPYFNNRIAEVKADLEKHLTPEIMRDSVNEIARRFVVSRNPVPGNTAQVPEFSLITRMRIRPDMVYRVEENRREMVFYYSGNYLLVQYELSGVLEYILAQKEFMIADLPQENSELVRINFVRKLFEGGFLEITS
nr:cupin domain-containing protein [uncultured Pedobacter sp.]